MTEYKQKINGYLEGLIGKLPFEISLKDYEKAKETLNQIGIYISELELFSH